MTQFEKEFVLKYAEIFKQILSNPDVLGRAIQTFTGNDRNHSRYHSNTTIPDAGSWANDDKLKFSAANFEATAQVQNHFLTNPDLAKEVILAKTLWDSDYLPLLLANTDPANRLVSLIINCDTIKEQLIAIEISNVIHSDQSISTTPKKHFAEAADKPHSSTLDNPYFFFSAVTAGIIVVAAGASLALRQ